MPNRHFLVKFWKCRKDVSIFLHEAKVLLEVFCLQPIVIGERQNSSSSLPHEAKKTFASWGKIKIHDFTLVDQDWIGLMIFKNFANQDWIGFNFIRSGLESDWEISLSAHLCYAWRTSAINDDTLLCFGFNTVYHILLGSVNRCITSGGSKGWPGWAMRHPNFWLPPCLPFPVLCLTSPSSSFDWQI